MTRTETRLFSFEDLRKFAEETGMNVFHVYYYGFDDGETGEDPHGVLYDVESLIEFLRNDTDYYYETVGHLIVCFDYNAKDRDAMEVVFP